MDSESSYSASSLINFQSSSFDNSARFIFTEHRDPFGLGNRPSNPTLSKHSEHDDDDEDSFDEHVPGKNYDLFERKLAEGFLEAPNLNLISVPPAMFDYQPPLQRVDLKDNKIEVLPEYFFEELPFLAWCDLRYNRILNLPPISATHENLKVLLLQDNQLTDLPGCLAHARNLETLGWTGNPILDPPRHVLLQGCSKVLEYLRSKYAFENPEDTESQKCFEEDDEQLRKDLENTLKKRPVKVSKSYTSVHSSDSDKSLADKKRNDENQKRRIDRIKYTWNLWKTVPYSGVSNTDLLAQSIEQGKHEMTIKINQYRESVLQKMKDKDALGKWRYDARVMQMKGPTKSYEGVKIPFGTEADVIRNPSRPSQEVDAATFKKTLTESMKRLQFLTENPTPIQDTGTALARLNEVENIHKKLFDMRVKWSVKSSNPI